MDTAPPTRIPSSEAAANETGEQRLPTCRGRTGKWFAREHWGIAPDIVQFAKAITSGYFPFGGVGMSDAIARVLDEAPGPWMHAYTYSGHPVGCAVALRTLQILDEENLVADARSSWTRCVHAWVSILTSARAFMREAIARGLYSRVRGDVVLLAPPFVTSDDVIDRAAEILAAATKAALSPV